MSIADQQRQINSILTNAKEKLRSVEERLELALNQKQSIDEDIQILSHRRELLQNNLSKKRSAHQAIQNLHVQSEEALKKLKDSTKTLLIAFKKQQKNVDAILKSISNAKDN